MNLLLVKGLIAASLAGSPAIVNQPIYVAPEAPHSIAMVNPDDHSKDKDKHDDHHDDKHKKDKDKHDDHHDDKHDDKHKDKHDH